MITDGLGEAISGNGSRSRERERERKKNPGLMRQETGSEEKKYILFTGRKRWKYDLKGKILLKRSKERNYGN